MLSIEIPISPEGWDEKKQEFVTPKTKVLQLVIYTYLDLRLKLIPRF